MHIYIIYMYISAAGGPNYRGSPMIRAHYVVEANGPSLKQWLSRESIQECKPELEEERNSHISL